VHAAETTKNYFFGGRKDTSYCFSCVSVLFQLCGHLKAHGTRPKFLVRDSGTRTWGENLGRVPWALDAV